MPNETVTSPEMNGTSLTHGALFNGLGGFCLAASKAGIKTCWVVEIDEFCNRVFKKHYPDVPQFTDVRTVRNLPYVDILSGGFPCKQTSLAAAIHGKRKGLDGIDSGLWYEQLRIFSESKPAWPIVENPSAVRQWEDTITRGLESLGYTVSRVESQANHYGLPHQRKRCFYVGNTDGKRLEIPRRSESPSTEWVKGLASSGGNWLQHTPGDGRGIDGLPNRVHRLRALGNSVAPDCAYPLFQAIKQHAFNQQPA